MASSTIFESIKQNKPYPPLTVLNYFNPFPAKLLYTIVGKYRSLQIAPTPPGAAPLPRGPTHGIDRAIPSRWSRCFDEERAPFPSSRAGRDVSTVLRVRVRSTGAHWARVRARRAASSERVHSRHRLRPLLGVRAALRSTRVASRQPARHPPETCVARRGMSGTSSPQQARWSGRPVYPRR